MCVSEKALFVFYEFIDWFFVENDKINTYNKMFYLLKYTREQLITYNT